MDRHIGVFVPLVNGIKLRYINGVDSLSPFWAGRQYVYYQSYPFVVVQKKPLAFYTVRRKRFCSGNMRKE
jgi:hypothetical protein